MTDAARLTARLLARKGEATPAIDPHAFSPLHGAGPGRWTPAGTGGHRERRADGARSPAEHASPPIETGRKKPPRTPDGRESDADAIDRRIAMTVRLDRERHLSLKLLSAQTRRSGQSLLVEALDMLFGYHLAETADGEKPNRSRHAPREKRNGAARG